MSSSYYSVIQYVPDQFADERVNVGVVVISPETGYSKAFFPDAERRARRLSPGAKLDFIDRLRRDLDARMPSREGQKKLGLIEPLTIDTLAEMHLERSNMLQFTAPRPSSADPEELVERLTAIYLPPLPQWHRSRGTNAVRGAIRRAIHEVGLGEHLREGVTARGRHDVYTFSFGLENGEIRHIIDAVSLGRLNKEEVRDDLHATAYRFEDLRKAHFGAPLSLVVEPGDETMLRRAQSILSDIDGAKVVVESGLPRWANKVQRQFHETA